MVISKTNENENEIWHALSGKEIAKRLKVSLEEGLSQSEAEKRLIQYGANTLPQKVTIPWYEILFRQFLSSFVYLLVIAAGIATFLNEVTDTLIIVAAIAITVGFGFLQEFKAERTLYALQALVKKTVHVVREGRNREIDSSLVVPGDIMIVGEGERISADARLIEVRNLMVDESAFTGESIPVVKQSNVCDAYTPVADRTNMVFRTTIAAHGRGKTIVIATGKDTEIGKIAQAIHSVGEGVTPLQEKISRVARLISFVVLFVSALLIIVGLARDFNLEELLTTAIAVGVAAIPESLVVAVTVILAIGMQRLLKEQALIRRLVSAETLGNTTVICVDKTGTVTEGKMRVSEVFTEKDDEKDKKLALLIGMIANEAYFDTSVRTDLATAAIKGDPTEQALMRAGIEARLEEKFLWYEKRITDELPFASENQFMATLVTEEGENRRLYVKGSPEKLLSFTKHIRKGDSNKAKMQRHVERLGGKGLRLLAVGYRDVPKEINRISQLADTLLENLTLVGIIALSDPPRPNVAETIAMAKEAGIRIIMITGDHRLTARTVGEEIGISVGEKGIITGEELNQLSDDDLKMKAGDISIYARIAPQDKLRIVRALQADGEVVAMTGDGINDAPALKQAEIGVAMGSGQDVAKEASDMVILDNDVSSIVKAVREGRVILDNIRKVFVYLLKDSFSELILIGSAILFNLPLPILAVQILWINIVEDAFPAFALAYEPAEEDVMRLKPEGKKRALLTREIKIIIFAIGIITDLLLLGILFWLLKAQIYSIEVIRTIIFAALAFNSLLVLFSLKSLRRSIFTINLFNNPSLVFSILFGVFMLIIAIYVPMFQSLLKLAPLSLNHWFLVISVGIIQFILIEIVKRLFTRKRSI